MFAVQQPKWRESDVWFLNDKNGGDSAGILDIDKELQQTLKTVLHPVNNPELREKQKTQM